MSWINRGTTTDEFGWDQQRWERGRASAWDFAQLAAAAGRELQTAQDLDRQARCVQALAFVVEHGSEPEQSQAHAELVSHARQSRPLDDAAAGARRLPEPARHALDVANRPEEGRELNLAGAAWYGLDLRDVDLSGAILTDANLSHTNLTGADLSQAELDRADLDNAELSGVNFTRAILRDASMRNAVADEAICSQTVLAGADAQDARFNAAVFSRADLQGARFNGADLTGTVLGAANLDGAQFVAADLTGAAIDWWQIRRADFTAAQLSGTALEGIQLPRIERDHVALPGLKKYEDAYTFDRAKLATSMPELLAAYDAAVSTEQLEQAADAIVEELAGPPDLTDQYDGEGAHEQWLIEYAEQTGIAEQEALAAAAQSVQVEPDPGLPISVQHLEMLQRRLHTAGAAPLLSPADDRTPAQRWRDIASDVVPYVVDEHWPAVEAALTRVQDSGGNPDKLLRTALARTPEPGQEERPGRGLHYRLLALDPAAVTPATQASHDVDGATGRLPPPPSPPSRPRAPQP